MFTEKRADVFICIARQITALQVYMFRPVIKKSRKTRVVAVPHTQRKILAYRLDEEFIKIPLFSQLRINKWKARQQKDHKSSNFPGKQRLFSVQGKTLS